MCLTQCVWRRVLAHGIVCWRMSVCAVDVAGYLEEYLELAVVKLLRGSVLLEDRIVEM